MEYLIGIAIGLLLGAFFGAGAGVSHKLEAVAARKRACSLVTADDYRCEAERLLGESLRTPGTSAYVYHLRQEAFNCFVTADKLENGPYKA